MIKLAVGIIVVVIILIMLVALPAPEGFAMPAAVRRMSEQAKQKLGMRFVAQKNTEGFNIDEINRSVAAARDNAATFSNTLQRRMGMSGAGESFNSQAVAKGTNWAGYM